MSQSILKFIRRHRFIITITLLGAFLRLYRLEASLQFLGDQGRDAIVLRNMLVNHDLPFIGPITSVGGFFLGPLYYYLMAPFLWLFNFNPAGPAYATTMIGIITIPTLFYITKKMLNLSAAKFTVFLYALASIPILQTRGAWNPNPMPLAALGIVYGFYQALESKKPQWLYLSALSLGAALQLHYMIVFLGPFIIYQLVLILKQKKLIKPTLIWFFIIALTMLPLILFEIKNKFININGLLAYLNKYEGGQITLWGQFRHLKGRSEQSIGMLLGFSEEFNVLREWLTRLVWLPALYLLFKKPSLGLKTVTLWIFLTIASLTFFQGRLPAYYLGFIFPAVFMLTGYLLSLLKGKFKIISLSLVVLFLYFNLATLHQDLRQTGNLRSVQKTAEFIKKDIDENNHQNYNLSLLDGTKDYKGYSFRYFLQVYGGQPLGIDQYPEADILYVISPYTQDPQEVLNHPIWEIRSLKPSQLTKIWEFDTSENIYKIERL
ncbi:ArnT family glycosyltransferase [Patescibacteria group bacterium]